MLQKTRNTQNPKQPGTCLVNPVKPKPKSSSRPAAVEESPSFSCQTPRLTLKRAPGPAGSDYPTVACRRRVLQCLSPRKPSCLSRLLQRLRARRVFQSKLFYCNPSASLLEAMSVAQVRTNPTDAPPRSLLEDRNLGQDGVQSFA